MATSDSVLTVGQEFTNSKILSKRIQQQLGTQQRKGGAHFITLNRYSTGTAKVMTCDDIIAAGQRRIVRDKGKDKQQEKRRGQSTEGHH